MHVIDCSSRGADGVRLADVNGDGLMDVATGWEEGGITRVYLQPGKDEVRKQWPAVTVGDTPNVEDALLVDLDGDRRTDVVSCCEGRTRTMFVHWAPTEPGRYLQPSAWKSEPVPASQNVMMWMFAIPLQVDGRYGTDLVAGGKGQHAQIGWFQTPQDPRRLDRWQWHPISPAGWIMSLRSVDMDGDGDLDVVTTDRRGDLRGCRWLENPGRSAAQTRPWQNHFIGGRQNEVMFMDIGDLDADGIDDVLAATIPQPLLWFRRGTGGTGDWDPFQIKMPRNAGSGKAVVVSDIDVDGKPDLVVSSERATGQLSGVVWLSWDGSVREHAWTAHPISGAEGIKFDRMELLDLDGDGDPDVLTCEESQPVQGKRRGLGVVWYENPTRRAPKSRRTP